jgi:heterodisulfide reductase subunit A
MDYRKAQELGVRFIRFRDAEPPHVERSPEAVSVHVEDADLGDAKFSLPADLVVLTVPVVPNIDSLELAKQLKVPLSKDRFFLEAHMKLRPVDFATEGIFIAGTAHWPKFAKECVDQAYAAVSRASTVLSKSTIEGEGIVSTVNACKCTGCGLCVDVCPFGAIDVSTGEAIVNEALCKGCGGCVVTCPSGAIQQKNLKDEQIIEMIKSAVIE